MDFRQGIVQKLPFADNTFDFILDRGCLHHQYDFDLKNYLKEVNRVLKAGGRMMIIAFTSRFSQEEIENHFKTNFKILDYKLIEEKSATGMEHEFHYLFMEKNK